MYFTWNSPVGVALAGGAFFLIATLIGKYALPLLTSESTADFEQLSINPGEHTVTASRENSGSIFDQDGDAFLLVASTTENDDFLWVGARAPGNMTEAFFEMDIHHIAKAAEPSRIEAAQLYFDKFRMSDNADQIINPPLVLSLFDYDTLEIDDRSTGSDWRGDRVRTIASIEDLQSPIDLTNEFRSAIKSEQLALRFHFMPAGVSSDERDAMVRIDPTGIRLVVTIGPQ